MGNPAPTLPPSVPRVVGLLNELYGATFATAMVHDQLAPLRGVFAWAARDFFDEALAGIVRDMETVRGVGATLAGGLNAYLLEHETDPETVALADGGGALPLFGASTPSGDVDAVRRALHTLTGDETRDQLWDALAVGLRPHNKGT